MGKLEELGHHLLRWSRATEREEKKNRIELEDRLSKLYNQDISEKVLAEITEVQVELNLEADKEELFWEQWARANWLKNGDRNTSYFHKVAVQRHFRGRIKELQDDRGRKANTHEELLQITTDFFVIFSLRLI